MTITTMHGGTISPDMPYKLSVEHMCCGHCESTIVNAVEPLDGITSVDANSDTNTVSVTGDEGAAPQVREAIKAAGFDMTP